MKGPERLLTALALLCCLCVQAQHFAWKGALDTVPQTGFYFITLSPEWLAAVKADVADVRILNEQEKNVPFLIKKEQPDKAKSLFRDFPVLKNTTDTAFTTLEIEVKSLGTTDHLDLLIGNTTAERKASISGSNDRRQWFIVEENLFLKNRSGYDKEQFAQTLALPVVRYRYLKLQIRNEGTDPLLIKAAGVFYNWREMFEPYFEKRPGFQQRDSADGFSYIRVFQGDDYPLEAIQLHLSGPKFYARELRVYSEPNRKGTELMATGRLQSNTETKISVPVQNAPIKTRSFLVTIENGDNPPLKIDSVTTQFRQRQLIAYLEKGKRYTLAGGDSLLPAPAYDLALFRDSIPTDLPEIKTGPMRPFAQREVVARQNNRWWLWPSIVAAIGLLTLLTVQLMREVKRKEA